MTVPVPTACPSGFGKRLEMLGAEDVDRYHALPVSFEVPSTFDRIYDHRLQRLKLQVSSKILQRVAAETASSPRSEVTKVTEAYPFSRKDSHTEFCTHASVASSN